MGRPPRGRRTTPDNETPLFGLWPSSSQASPGVGDQAPSRRVAAIATRNTGGPHCGIHRRFPPVRRLAPWLLAGHPHHGASQGIRPRRSVCAAPTSGLQLERGPSTRIARAFRPAPACRSRGAARRVFPSRGLGPDVHAEMTQTHPLPRARATMPGRGSGITGSVHPPRSAPRCQPARAAAMAPSRAARTSRIRRVVPPGESSRRPDAEGEIGPGGARSAVPGAQSSARVPH